MELGDEIVLRPRFKIELNHSNETVLSAFEASKDSTKGIVLLRIDDHVFIKIPKEDQHFWSPQLDLEIISFEEGESVLHGVFGPKPSVWTLFMFFHFIVGTLFIGIGIWAYTNASLKTSFTVQLVLLFLLGIVWFALYFAGRMGKSTGKKEMILLNTFMKKILEPYL